MQTGKFGIRWRVAGAALTWSLGAALAAPQLSLAAGTYSLGAQAGVDYNSNVFDVGRGVELPANVHQRSDIIQDYTVTGDAAITENPVTFTVGVKGTHFEYDHIGVLSHNEEHALADVKYTPGTLLDLELRYVYDRTMAPFAQTLTQTLSIDTNQTATAILGIAITPVWRLELEPAYHEALTPLLGIAVGENGGIGAPGTPGQLVLNFPDFRLDEKSLTATLDYRGQAHLTAGIDVSYDEGRYSHIVAATKYRQVGTAFVATYKINDLSSLNANLGYTTRNTVANPDDSIPLSGPQQTAIGDAFTGGVGRTGGVTGQLAYSRSISPKTTVDVNAFRMVASYVAGANAVLTTGIGGDVHWRPDSKLEFIVNVAYQADEFTGGTVNAGGAGNDRTDHSYSAGILGTWAALRWLSVIGHTTYTDRESNLSLAGYSAFEIGVDVKAVIQ